MASPSDGRALSTGPWCRSQGIQNGLNRGAAARQLCVASSDHPCNGHNGEDLADKHWMGFDPRRRWPSSSSSRPVTCNVEALLAENDALRREVRSLRLQLLQQSQQPPDDRYRDRSARHGLSAAQVERWGEAMACHPRWRTLRLGPPGGLRGLIEAQRARWWNPRLQLEEELDRRSPGLGAELAEALRGPHSRSRWAVRAAFAVYGQRAPEWLNDDPVRVVDELLRRVQRLEPPRRGTRTANHSEQRAEERTGGDGRRHAQAEGGAAQQPEPHHEQGRLGALRLLGLEPGAGLEQIKRAYRRLAKAHHPDLGGDVRALHRLERAYRLLLS